MRTQLCFLCSWGGQQFLSVYIHQPQAERQIYYNITTAGTLMKIYVVGAVATAVTVQRKL